MLAYKGFDKDLKCRGFQYEIGGEYETDHVEVCECGFHACECPFDVLRYYRPIDGNRYCEVELSGKIARDAKDTKVAATRIRIIRELTADELAEAHKQWVRDHATNAETGGDRAILSGGNHANSSGGDEANLAGGYRANLTGGDCARLSGGNRSNLIGGAAAILSGGYYANLSGGNCANLSGGAGANLSGGDCAILSGGYYANLSGGAGANLSGGDLAHLSGGDRANLSGGAGANLSGGDGAILAAGDEADLSGGDGSIATCGGAASVGKKGCAVVRGCGVRVRGGLGSVLVICNENPESYEIQDWKAVVVDGIDVKADTWYRLEDGELVECPERD